MVNLKPLTQTACQRICFATPVRRRYPNVPAGIRESAMVVSTQDDPFLTFSRRETKRMSRSHDFHRLRRYLIKCAISAAAFAMIASASSAQSVGTAKVETPWSKELKKYPGLLPELGRLAQKLRQNVQFPPSRTESRLLPLLPESTAYYGAISNYGDSAHQALAIFRQELQESAVLKDWWTHGDLATSGPKIEDAIEKFGLLHQYLGDEIVLSGSFDAEHKDATPVLLAEIRKPGLEAFLKQWLVELAGKSEPSVRVFNSQELAAAKDIQPGKDMYVLVRPDFVVVSPELATLRSFNAGLKSTNRQFASTAFGQTVAHEYQGGLTLLAATDLHQVLKQALTSIKESHETFHRSGFDDMKYVVWKRTTVAGQSVSQGELTFSGPRHGAAAWLAKPAPLGSLDFVAPDAMFATTLILASPAQIFDDVKELSGPSSAGTFAMIAGGEKGLNLSLKDDLLALLTGEITGELDTITPQPVWKAMLKVNDVNHLQKTLTTLLAVGQIPTEHAEAAGLSYNTFRIPSQKKPTELAYAFVDGYLLVASSPEELVKTAHLHTSGESLARSKKFIATLPPGHSPDASALFYQNPTAMWALQLKQLAPELADPLAQISKEIPPSITRVYGEESSIREASNSGMIDVGMPLVVAAIAIPNLLRSRIAANEASAVGSLRSVNTAQVTYAATYPDRGFAPNLATFGSDPHAPTTTSPEHAGFLDKSLAGATCTGDAWCTKSGYHFRVTVAGKLQPRKEYLVVATPVETNTGTRSFCSTSDGIIRFKFGPPLTSSISVSECRAWPPLQ